MKAFEILARHLVNILATGEPKELHVAIHRKGPANTPPRISPPPMGERHLPLKPKTVHYCINGRGTQLDLNMNEEKAMIILILSDPFY